MEIITRLSTLAGSIDNSIVADIVFDVADSLTKTAQYVGSQGYWIANSRCWSNCYRQKRSKSPSMAAQDVWAECQEEYQSHVEGNSDSWFKYAESENAIKTSSSVEHHFNTKLKISHFDDAGSRVADAIVENISEMKSQLISSSVTMAKVAATGGEYAEEAAQISAELLKEAGLWDGISNMWQGALNGVKGIGQGIATSGKITNIQKQIKSQWAAIIKELEQFNALIAQSRQYFDEKAKSPNARARGLAGQALATLGKVQILRVNQPALLQVDNALNELDQIITGLAPTSQGSSAVPAAAGGAAGAPTPQASGATSGGTAGTQPAVPPSDGQMLSKIPQAQKQPLIDLLKELAGLPVTSAKTAQAIKRKRNVKVPPVVGPSIGTTPAIPQNGNFNFNKQPGAFVRPKSVSVDNMSTQPGFSFNNGKPNVNVQPAPMSAQPGFSFGPKQPSTPSVQPTPPPTAPAQSASPSSQTNQSTGTGDQSIIDSILSQVPEGNRQAILQLWRLKVKEVYDKVVGTTASRTIFTLSKRS